MFAEVVIVVNPHLVLYLFHLFVCQTSEVSTVLYKAVVIRVVVKELFECYHVYYSFGYIYIIEHPSC